MVSRAFSTWKKVQLPGWTAPLALLLAALLSYGLRLNGLGFYWDDWPYLYLYQIGGYPALYHSLGADRPLLSALYALTLGVLGSSPLAWQVFALLMRWLLGWAFLFVLRQLWPQRPMETLSAALLFMVYPGFSQQWISIVWGNAFVLYGAVLLSLGLSLWALRTQAGAWRLAAQVAALLLSAWVIFSTEYFIGLEILRPLLIWLVLAGQGWSAQKRLRAALCAWLPFVGLLLVFAIWRLFLQSSAHGGFYLFREPFLSILSILAQRLLQDLSTAAALAWAQAFGWLGGLGQNWRELLVALAGGVAAWLVLLKTRTAEEAGQAPAWGGQALGLGLLAFGCAGWPVWIAMLPLRLEFPWDRYSLSLMPAAALLAGGFVHWAGRNKPARALLAALLVAASIGYQAVESARYQAAWQSARDLFWQLSWRAPQLQPGTLLLSGGKLPEFYEDDSLTAPLNWLYAGAEKRTGLDYAWMDSAERFRKLNFLQPGSPAEMGAPGAEFRGNTSQAVVVLVNPEACLQVLDAQRDVLRTDLPDFARRALPLSRPELIGNAQPGSEARPPALFGAEPRQGWCYDYQKAALAAQQGDWEEALSRIRAGYEQGRKPTEASEFLLLVEVALRNAAWMDAQEYSRAGLDLSYSIQPELCKLWGDAGEWGSDWPTYRQILPEFSCTE